MTSGLSGRFWLIHYHPSSQDIAEGRQRCQMEMAGYSHDKSEVIYIYVVSFYMHSICTNYLRIIQTLNVLFDIQVQHRQQ